jgi:hypothetical protein
MPETTAPNITKRQEMGTTCIGEVLV